jgi:hypothetical protein
MKGKKTLIIVIVVLVLLGIAGFVVRSFYFKRLNSGSGIVSNLLKNAVTKEEGTSAGDIIRGTLDQVLGSGKSVKCTYSGTTEGTKVEAISYISGEKFRTDSTTTVPEEGPIEFHMISDGDNSYMWGTTMETGIKMKYSDYQKSGNDSAEPGSAADKFNLASSMKGYNYDCKPWLGDPTKFVVPTNVQFQDLSEMMKGLEDLTKNMTQDLCKNCNDLNTAEQIATCRESLKCDSQ